MGGHNRRSLPRLAKALVMASTASALSLANFQVITSSSVNLACIVAYNTQISGCTTEDFTKGNTCSSGCERGLAKVENTLQSVCDDGTVSSATVLGQALLGNLVGLLCPSDTTATTSSTSLNTQTSTAAVVITSTRTTATLGVNPSSIIKTTSSTLQETTASVLESTISSTESAVASPVTVETTPLASSTTSLTTATQQAQSTAQSTTQSSGDTTPGGGSPFDAQVSASDQLSARIIPPFAVLALSLLLLW